MGNQSYVFKSISASKVFDLVTHSKNTNHIYITLCLTKNKCNMFILPIDVHYSMYNSMYVTMTVHLVAYTFYHNYVYTGLLKHTYNGSVST